MRRRLSLILTLSLGASVAAVSWAQGPADKAADSKAANEVTETDTPTPPAKKYRELPVNESLRGGGDRVRISNLLRNRQLTPSDQQAVDAYFKEYELPRWTQPKNLATLNKARAELRRWFYRVQGQPRDHLNKLVMDYMQKFLAPGGADEPFAPAVQINAILMIGELEQSERSTAADAAPLPQALPVLLRILDDTNANDGMRAAALVGIARHVAMGLKDEALRRQVTAAMLKIAAADIDANLAARGRVWILGQAAEILGNLHAVGNDNSVYKALLAIAGNAALAELTDTELAFSTRITALRALGSLKYAGAKGIDVGKAATVFGQFVVGAAEDGIYQAEKKIDVRTLRRSMRPRLDAVLTALNGDKSDDHKGLLALATDQQKEHLAKLQGDIEAALDVVNDAKVELPDLQISLQELLDKVTEWLKEQPE